MQIFRTVCTAVLSIAVLAACSSGGTRTGRRRLPSHPLPASRAPTVLISTGPSNSPVVNPSPPNRGLESMRCAPRAPIPVPRDGDEIGRQQPEAKGGSPARSGARLRRRTLANGAPRGQHVHRQRNPRAVHHRVDLEPQPDGTLTGTSWVAMNPSPECGVATQTPVTVTRVGDVDLGIAVADPAKQAPLSPSAPEGLTGHYNETSVLQDSSKPGVRRVAMQTTCVRNTDQCTTFKSYQTAPGPRW